MSEEQYSAEDVFIQGQYYSYNSYGDLSSVAVTTPDVGTIRYIVEYGYDDHTFNGNQGNITTWEIGSTDYLMYNSYDDLNRLSEQGMQYGYDSTTGTNLYAIKNYGYKSSSNGGTTSLVSSLTYSGNVSLSYTYDYDSLGNITAVYKNGTVIASYVYDNLGQLTRENNKESNKTWVYTYDDRGNITSRKTYVYTTGTLGEVQSTDSYTYFEQWDEAMWNDGLKSYNGSATFTYDAIGNPLTYNNGSAYTFTWQNGRQLASATKGSTTYTYTYNSDGLRTSKTVGSTVYNYYWQGSQLVAMTLENSSGVVTATYKFYYDSNGMPFIFDYNGTIYYYVTNLQGDVVGLADEYGISARYTYDAWGNIIKMDAATNAPYYAMVANPLRYRGYVYDTETGFYYLQSRYYDPEVGRFINSDSIVPKATGSCKGYNLYAYCFNNPINMSDSQGNWPTWDDVAKLYEAFVRSIDIEFGVGFGFGISKNICGVEVEAAAYQDGITVGVKDGDSYTSIKGSAGVSAKVADSLGVDYSLSYEHRFETNSERTNCEDINAYSMFWDVLSCEHTSIDTPDGVSTSLKFVSFDDLSISFSGSQHVGVGYHYSVNFNLYEFFEVLFE